MPNKNLAKFHWLGARLEEWPRPSWFFRVPCVLLAASSSTLGIKGIQPDIERVILGIIRVSSFFYILL